MALRSTWESGAGRQKLVRRGGAAVAAVALAVALGGCGSNDDTASTSASAAPATAVTAVTPEPVVSGTTAAAGGAYGSTSSTPAGGAQTTPGSVARAGTVTIDDFKFDPANATFKVGQKVTVVNKDSAPHTWTSTAGGFDTGTLEPGKSTTVTLTKAGTFDVICTIHPSMKGSVTVQP